MLLWLAVLWVLFKEKRDSAVSSVLLSFHTTVILLSAFLAACLVQGFSSVKLTGTWWFTAIVFALLSHLFMVIIRGSIRPRPFRARFLLNHAGLFLALAGGLFGSPDTQRWRTIVKLAEPVTEAVDTDGNLIRMPYRLQLTGFCVDSYRDGRPGNYEVTLTAQDKKASLRTVILDIDRKTYVPLCVRMQQGGNGHWTRISIHGFHTGQAFKASDFEFNASDFPQAEVIDLR